VPPLRSKHHALYLPAFFSKARNHLRIAAPIAAASDNSGLIKVVQLEVIAPFFDQIDAAKLVACCLKSWDMSKKIQLFVVI
jgi:hypothetical protein